MITNENKISKPSKIEAQSKGNNKINNKVLKEIKMELLELKKNYKEALKSPEEAIQSVKSNPKFKKDLDDVVFKNKSRGKLKYLEMLVGDKFIHKFVPDFSDLSVRNKIECVGAVFADDLTPLLGALGGGSVQSILSSLALEYGPKIIDWLYSKAKSKIQNYKPKGSGMGSLQYPKSTELDLGRFGVPRTLKDCNSVYVPFLCNLFCPEVYSCACPEQFGPLLASSSITVNFNLVTDTSGNSIFYALPDATTQVGGSASAWYAASNTSGTVNIFAGTMSTPTYSPGPFSTQATAIEGYRVTAGATRIVFNLAALNNSGSCMLAYTTNPPEEFGAGAPAITQNAALQFPYCHIAAVNGTAEMRQIHVPHQVNDLSLDSFGQNLQELQDEGAVLDLVYANIVGGPATTIVGRVYCTSNIDWAPTETGILLNKPVQTPEGVGTLPAAAAIIKRIPHITQLTLAEAEEFAGFIADCQDDTYSGVVSAALEFAGKYKKRPKNLSLGGGAPAGSVGEMSFEVESS